MNETHVQAKLYDALDEKVRGCETGSSDSSDPETAVRAIMEVIPNATLIGPTGPSFTSDVLKIGDRSEIWLSIFGNLATTVGEPEIDTLTLEKMRKTLAGVGWTLVPENVVAEQISEEVRDVWFTELFGYY